MNDDVIKHIKKHTIDTHYSRFLAQPQMDNGFIIFIHKSKDKMEFVNESRFKGKNFYHVTNPFEHQIINNTETRTDIATYSKEYFNLGSSLGITSRAFYKLWEMLMIFDTVPSSGKIVSAHLAEAPGSFVQALMFYREKFYKKADYDKDEHYTISLNDVGIPAFKKEFKRTYSKVKIYEQDGGDLTDIRSINKFEKFSKKADLITADGGFEWKNENYQEQEAFRLILGEIITALKTQKIGGTFIIKLFEVYTDVSIKILMILSAVYTKTFMFKPLTSRPSNSERYMVCKKFKGADDKLIGRLEALLNDMNMHESSGLYIASFMDGFQIPLMYKYSMNVSSSTLSNLQHVAINKLISYIRSNNYFGDLYHQYLEDQQNANDFWAQTFYPINGTDLRVVRKTLNDITTKIIEDGHEEIEQYSLMVKPIII